MISSNGLHTYYGATESKSMNNEPNIYIIFSWAIFPVMAAYGFACQVWFPAGKHDQKTQSADFSLQSVVKCSKVRCIRYTQHTNQRMLFIGVFKAAPFFKKNACCLQLVPRTNGQFSFQQPHAITALSKVL